MLYIRLHHYQYSSKVWIEGHEEDSEIFSFDNKELARTFAKGMALALSYDHIEYEFEEDISS
jgi:hypothetical protein